MSVGFLICVFCNSRGVFTRVALYIGSFTRCFLMLCNACVCLLMLSRVS